MKIVFEIIELLVIFGVVITIFILKGGTIKDFLKMVLFFIVAALTLSVVSDQYQIWKNKKNKIEIEVENYTDIDLEEEDSILEAMIKSLKEDPSE